MPMDPMSLAILFGLLAQAARKALATTFGAHLKSHSAAGSPSPIIVSYGNEFAQEFLSLVLESLGASKNSKLDEVLAALEVLRGGPLERALIQLTDAERVEIQNDEDRIYQIERYRQALVSLDEAESLAAPAEMTYVLMLKAMVKAFLPGGSQSAKFYAERVRRSFAADRADVEAEMRENEVRVAEHERRLSKLPKPEKWRMGGGLAGGSISQRALERGEYEMRLRKLQNNGHRLAAKLGDIEALDKAMETIATE